MAEESAINQCRACLLLENNPLQRTLEAYKSVWPSRTSPLGNMESLVLLAYRIASRGHTEQVLSRLFFMIEVKGEKTLTLTILSAGGAGGGLWFKENG